MVKHHNVLRGTYHNILAEFDGATDQQHEKGWRWYPDMRSWCESTAVRFDVFVGRVIGAFAVLSPMITVDQCKNAVIEVLTDGGTHLNYPANVEKSRQIIDHAIYEAISGPKVVAFEQAIDDPLGNTTPVIDRHAVSVYMGRQILDGERKGLERVKVRTRIENAYRRAAKARRVPVHVMQAVTWQSYRERNVAWAS